MGPGGWDMGTPTRSLWSRSPLDAGGGISSPPFMFLSVLIESSWLITLKRIRVLYNLLPSQWHFSLNRHPEEFV